MKASTARHVFAKNDRVKLSRAGVEQLRSLSRKGRRSYDHGTRGTVIGFGRQAHLVRIVRDGLTTPETYHFELWIKAE